MKSNKEIKEPFGKSFTKTEKHYLIKRYLVALNEIWAENRREAIKILKEHDFENTEYTQIKTTIKKLKT
jgi:hypothetical protein